MVRKGPFGHSPSRNELWYFFTFPMIETQRTTLEQKGRRKTNVQKKNCEEIFQRSTFLFGKNL